MKNVVFLNCNEATEKNYCSNCGQKTDTHPITLKHFLFHDLLHGFWHLEKGILFTLKEVITRPGQAALDYINGKRIRYYNVFYLCLFIIAIDAALLHFKQSSLREVIEVDKKEDLGDLMAKFSKITLFGFVPLLAFNAKLFFRRLKLNYAQHLIIGGISLLGCLLISIFYFLFDVLNQWLVGEVFGYLELICFFCMPFFPIWSYYNASRRLYSFWGFSWRMFLFYIFLFAQFLLILYSIGYLFYGGANSIEVEL